MQLSQFAYYKTVWLIEWPLRSPDNQSWKLRQISGHDYAERGIGEWEKAWRLVTGYKEFSSQGWGHALKIHWSGYFQN